MLRSGLACLVSCSLLGGPVLAQARTILDESVCRDKVYACWLGKSIGGTLGLPVEGRREMHSFTYYDPVPTDPGANDDLDLQLLWLKALEDRGPRIDARALGEYWLSFVPVDWNEYGIGKANMRQGFLPPISGQFRNKWRDSNGAWIRSEIWACVAPGCPAVAARYAYEDACVDHGGAEGTFAEVFTATVESAAFVNSDRDELIRIGLSYIPADCAVAASIHAALDARARGLDLAAAREAVVEASASTGWFMAPQNVAFVVLGWLYGDDAKDGDTFGASICAAVNCGDDTDCTGATLGSILGIIGGTAAIPERWRAPVGEGIRNVAIGGFTPPQTLSELTDRTVAAAKAVLADARAPVEIARANGAWPTVPAESLVDAAATAALWSRSPYAVTFDLVPLTATVDYGGEPVIGVAQPATIMLTLANETPDPLTVDVTWRMSEGVTVDIAATALELPASGEPVACTATLAADEVTQPSIRGSVELAVRGRPTVLCIPVALGGAISVLKGDLALARLGATATSDSELEREPGCTAKVVDGEIAPPDGFEGARWHSALTPHPHWVAITLPEAREVGRVIVHFADPGGHPVDFRGEVSTDGDTWEAVFSAEGYAEPTRYETAFEPRPVLRFRLVIDRSASQRWPDAAQVSEIELLPT